MKIFHLFILLMLFTSLHATDVNKKNGDMPAIVSINWLKANLSNKKLVILDIREYKEYQKGHIKGAVNLPGLESLFDANSWKIPKLDKLKELFSKAGIDKDSLVVAYDNGEFIWAARLYWILEVLGHKNVGILKYSFGNHIKKHLPISTKDTIVKEKEFVPMINDNQIETKLSTLLAIGNKTIIDGRETSHYKGEESIAKRFGHIPTAKNYACTNNFQVTNDGSKMKDFGELKKVYKDIPKDKDIILYCQGGAQAALNYIVLQELGYKASVYDGSWKEWGNDLAVPIENKSKKK